MNQLPYKQPWQTPMLDLSSSNETLEAEEKQNSHPPLVDWAISYEFSGQF